MNGPYGQPEEAGAGWSWLAPLAAGLTGQLTDPVREYAVLRAQYEDAITRGRPASVITTIRAKMLAAERRAMLAEEGATRTRAWNQIGQLAAVAGIGLLVGGVALTTLKVYKAWK